MDEAFIDCYQAAFAAADPVAFLEQRGVNAENEPNEADYYEYWRLHRIALAACLRDLNPPRVLLEGQGMPPARAWFVECYQDAAAADAPADFLALCAADEPEELNEPDWNEYWRLHRIALEECLHNLHPPRILLEWQGMPPPRALAVPPAAWAAAQIPPPPPPPLPRRIAKEIKRLLAPAVRGAHVPGYGTLRNWFRQGGGRKTRRKKTASSPKEKKTHNETSQDSPQNTPSCASSPQTPRWDKM